MTDLNVKGIFDLLDDWRNLPSYQLERRADIFFGLFLPEVLKKNLGVEMNSCLIPEFPLRQVRDDDYNLSDKVDYLALSKDSNQAFLVELKTNADSQEDDQADYLERAVERGMGDILCGVKKLFLGTQTQEARKKYFHLMKKLVALKLVEKLPDNLCRFVHSKRANGISKCIESIKIGKSLPVLERENVIYSPQ